MANQLVFDVGMHEGEDTDYYLSKGYRVVAVDADPVLIELAGQQFGEARREGRLVLVNCAVADEEGEADFHVSEQTLWNSLSPGISGRDHLATKTIRVPTRRLANLFREYGVPFYCKIDIEGWDLVCLKTLEDAPELPAYVSVETECIGDSERLSEAQALETLEQLQRLGYRGFKLVDQRSLAVLTPSASVYLTKPSIWRRAMKRLGLGGYTYYNHYELSDKNRRRLNELHHHTFPPGSSGLFGPDLAGDWMDIHAARRTLLRHRREYFRMPDVKAYGFWCDWHATR